eukprot:4910459-Amphidinium_carterae.1
MALCEDREGSLLGTKEFARNMGIVGDGFRKVFCTNLLKTAHSRRLSDPHMSTHVPAAQISLFQQAGAGMEAVCAWSCTDNQGGQVVGMLSKDTTCAEHCGDDHPLVPRFMQHCWQGVLQEQYEETIQARRENRRLLAAKEVCVHPRATLAQNFHNILDIFAVSALQLGAVYLAYSKSVRIA